MQARDAGPQRWTARQAWRYGMLLFVLDMALAVVLLPLLLHWLPVADIALWTSMTAGLALVNAAVSPYSQGLLRAVAGRRPASDLPSNQAALLRRADSTGVLLLLLLQTCLAAWLADRQIVGASAGWAALCVYFFGMHLRLAALNRFIWTNALQQLGRDKRLLVQASAVTLILAVLLAAWSGSVLGLAVSAAAGSGWLLLQAVLACRTLGHNPAAGRVAWPAKPEMVGLLLLNLAGFLNLGTDVLVANHLLAPAQAVAYAFWSRALMSSALLVGLYTQIRFPQWPLAAQGVLRRELTRGLLALAALPPLAMLAEAAARQVPALAGLVLQPPWMLAVMACTTALACASILAGQMSTARASTGFLLPAAGMAAAAPLLASAAADRAGGTWFVTGYLLANAALCLLTVAWAWRATRPTTGAAAAATGTLP